MTKAIAIALVAAIGFVGTPAAATPTLVAKAQRILNDYNFRVDASTLTNHQLARFHLLDNSEGEADSRIRAKIRAILR